MHLAIIGILANHRKRPKSLQNTMHRAIKQCRLEACFRHEVLKTIINTELKQNHTQTFQFTHRVRDTRVSNNLKVCCKTQWTVHFWHTRKHAQNNESVDLYNVFVMIKNTNLQNTKENNNFSGQRLEYEFWCLGTHFLFHFYMGTQTARLSLSKMSRINIVTASWG